MRKLMSIFLIFGVLLLTATSRSDVAPVELLSATPLEEPITGRPVSPTPSAETALPPKDPFTPYDTGPESATWRYRDLSPAERAVADRGRTADDSKVNDAFASASAEQAKHAAAGAAASQLGVAGLAEIGVVR